MLTIRTTWTRVAVFSAISLAWGLAKGEPPLALLFRLIFTVALSIVLDGAAQALIDRLIKDKGE